MVFNNQNININNISTNNTKFNSTYSNTLEENNNIIINNNNNTNNSTAIIKQAIQQFSSNNKNSFNAKMIKITNAKLDNGITITNNGKINLVSGGYSSSSSSSNGGGGGGGSNEANGGKKLSSEDKKINLNALKNQDPFATNIIDTAFRVAVYKFVSKKNEWKKLDVEGSLFLFERMVEPLHSFVVMNTLALHLFLQPITSDLEFQDRNPFLLYKYNSDIYGIWFIDKEDCERIKSLIINLTDLAKERRLKREKSCSIAEQIQNPESATKCSFLEEQFKCPGLITPTSILSHTTKTASNKYENQTTITTADEQVEPAKPDIDIMKMLSKAQVEYNQSKKTTSLETNVTGNSLLHIINNTNKISNENSKELSIAQWSQSKSNIMMDQPDQQQQQQPISLNTSSLSSSPPASSASSTSTGYSSSSAREEKKLNPILQLLLPTVSTQNEPSQKLQMHSIEDTKQASMNLKNVINSINAKTTSSSNTSINLPPSAQDLITLELKRKLNIQPSSQQQAGLANDSDADKSLSSSLMQTPCNQLILNNFGTGCVNTLDQSSIKRPITLRDFEENLLNESSTSTPSNQMYQQSTAASSTAVFYLSDSTSNLMLKPSHLTFSKNENKDLKQYSSSSSNSSSSSSASHHSSSSAASTLSSRSSRSSSTSSSTSSKSTTSSEPPMSPTTLPLLLTPAAFESSSVSSSTSTTSSSKVSNNHHFFDNHQHVSLLEQQQLANKKPTSTNSTNSLAASSFGNILFSNQLINFNDFAAAAASKSSSKTKSKKSKSSQLNQLTVLTKSQLKQVMINLLTNDDKFITSLHQAYLEANIQNSKASKLSAKHKTATASATAFDDVKSAELTTTTTAAVATTTQTLKSETTLLSN